MIFLCLALVFVFMFFFFMFFAFIFRIGICKTCKKLIREIVMHRIVWYIFLPSISIFIWMQFFLQFQSMQMLHFKLTFGAESTTIFRLNVNDIMENNFCDKTISCIFMLHSHTLSLSLTPPYMNIVILHWNWKNCYLILRRK